MKMSNWLYSILITSIMVIITVSPAKADQMRISRIKKVTKADIQMAEITLRKAIKVNNVWRDTEKLIAEAKKAKQEKKFKIARNLATEALYQAELALKQASKHKDLEFPAYLK